MPLVALRLQMLYGFTKNTVLLDSVESAVVTSTTPVEAVAGTIASISDGETTVNVSEKPLKCYANRA
jgi:hypothetical protein